MQRLSSAVSKPATQLLSIATIAALVVAFLGGKYSFGRFLDETAVNAWFELRLWFTAAAMLGLCLQQALGVLDRFRPSEQLRWMVGAVLVFSAALFAHVLAFSKSGFALPYAVDAFYLALHAVLFAYAFRTREHVLTFCYVVEAIAVMFVILVLVGFRNVVIDGAGWAPFGSPITFYRLEFLACCSALYVMTVSNRSGVQLLQLLVASTTLFATYSSLARAAVFSSVLAAVYMVVVFLIVARPKMAAWVGAFFVVVTAGFLAQSSGFAQRMSEFKIGALTNGAANAMASPPNGGLTDTSDAGAARDGGLIVMVAMTQVQLRAQELPPSAKPGSNLHDDEQLLRTNRLALIDDTYRIRLFLQAWKLFQENKLLGAGFGTYEVQARNYAGNAPTTYRHPHNVVLEVLYATGVVGFVLFGFSVAAGLVVLHQAIRMEANWVFLAAYALSVLFSSMVTGDIYDFRGFFLIAIMAAGVAWHDDGRKV